MRQLVTAAASLLVLAACAPEPFDATGPWQPLRDTGEGRAYRGGMMAAAPRSTFEEFETGQQQGQPERGQPEQGANTPSGAQSRVPSPSRGENPWATIPQNPVVTVCYGSVVNDMGQVREAAKRLCPEGARLELIQSTNFQSDCPLLQPTRAAFRCWTDPRGSAEAGLPPSAERSRDAGPAR